MKKFFASAFYSDHKYWNRYGWWSYEKSCRNGSRQRCFKILVAAVKVAGLVENWAGKGPFTPFALKNEAFAKLPESTVESLLEPEKKDKLISILTYHVIPGKVMSKDIKPSQMVKTVNGQQVSIKLSYGKVSVDGANVTAADVEADNGVIHVIDSVILPKN